MENAAVALPPELAPGQPCDVSTVPGKAPGEVLFKLACNGVSLPDLVRSIAKITKKNFLFDDRLRGTVTIIPEQPVAADEAYTVFRAALRVKGFAVVDRGEGALEIRPTEPEATSPR